MTPRWSIALVAVACLAGTAGACASAGTYAVRACADSGTHANHSWTAHNNDEGPGQLETGGGCGTTGDYAGLFGRDALTCDSVCALPVVGASAGWRFSAPTGTTVTNLSYSRWLYKADDDNWDPELLADNVPLETCSIAYPGYSCTVGAPGGGRVNVAISRSSSLDVAASCAPNPTGHCGGGGTLHHVAAVLYGATVTLSDSTVPSLSNVGGSLFAGGYLTGGKEVDFSASDNVGIRSARVYVDGGARPGDTFSCDFTYAVPCSNVTAGHLAVDTTAIEDGVHSVQIAASDPAGNEVKSTARTVTVDNSAPGAPEQLTVEGGSDWRSTDSFSVTWTNPSGQVAPVAAAHYRVCAPDGSSCGADQEIAGTDLSRIDGIQVPSTGEWTLEVWLEDAAGNVNGANTASTILRYGSAPATTTTTGAQPAPSASTSTTTGADAPAPTATVLTPPSLTAPPADTITPLPRSRSRLRITSATMRHGRLLVRGRLARRARGAVVVRVVSGHRRTVVRRTLKGGRFTLRLPGHRAATRVSLRYLGSPRFLPSGATRAVNQPAR
jgi:hypothetical protein